MHQPEAISIIIEIIIRVRDRLGFMAELNVQTNMRGSIYLQVTVSNYHSLMGSSFQVQTQRQRKHGLSFGLGWKSCCCTMIRTAWRYLEATKGDCPNTVAVVNRDTTRFIHACLTFHSFCGRWHLEVSLLNNFSFNIPWMLCYLSVGNMLTCERYQQS